MSKIIKNTTGSVIAINDTGISVPANSQYTVPATDYNVWAESANVLSYLTSGDLVVNDGSNDLSVSDGLNLLRGFFPKDIKVNNNVPIKKPEGDSVSYVSHDFCNKCTWYQDSTRKTGETLSGAALVYTAPHANWIDLEHGHHTDEDTISSSYIPVIYDNGSVISSGYSINYTTGVVTFTNTPTGPVTADYSIPGSSTWTLEPPSGYKYTVTSAELDFSTDCAMSKVHFDVWAYNPYYDSQQSTDADDPTWKPGDSGNPLRFLYFRKTYKNYKDILKVGNSVQVIPVLSGLTENVLRVEFNYGKSIPLLNSSGMQLRITIADETPFVGEWGTITLYIEPEAE